jgi:hypothetical protein
VKITVIATGFQPESEPVPEKRSSDFFSTPPPRWTEPPPPPPQPEIVPEPEPDPVVIAEAVEPPMDVDDVEVPAYLRSQRRLVN